MRIHIHPAVPTEKAKTMARHAASVVGAVMADRGIQVQND